LFGRIDDTAPDFCILDPQKGVSDNPSEVARKSSTYDDVGDGVYARGGRQAFEEEAYLDVQDVSELL
jgi:hypothetical protein